MLKYVRFKRETLSGLLSNGGNPIGKQYSMQLGLDIAAANFKFYYELLVVVGFYEYSLIFSTSINYDFYARSRFAQGPDPFTCNWWSSPSFEANGTIAEYMLHLIWFQSLLERNPTLQKALKNYYKKGCYTGLHKRLVGQEHRIIFELMHDIFAAEDRNDMQMAIFDPADAAKEIKADSKQVADLESDHANNEKRLVTSGQGPTKTTQLTDEEFFALNKLITNYDGRYPQLEDHDHVDLLLATLERTKTPIGKPLRDMLGKFRQYRLQYHQRGLLYRITILLNLKVKTIYNHFVLTLGAADGKDLAGVVQGEQDWYYDIFQQDPGRLKYVVARFWQGQEILSEYRRELSDRLPVRLDLTLADIKHLLSLDNFGKVQTSLFNHYAFSFSIKLYKSTGDAREHFATGSFTMRLLKNSLLGYMPLNDAINEDKAVACMSLQVAMNETNITGQDKASTWVFLQFEKVGESHKGPLNELPSLLTLDELNSVSSYEVELWVTEGQRLINQLSHTTDIHEADANGLSVGPFKVGPLNDMYEPVLVERGSQTKQPISIGMTVFKDMDFPEWCDKHMSAIIENYQRIAKRHGFKDIKVPNYILLQNQSNRRYKAKAASDESEQTVQLSELDQALKIFGYKDLDEFHQLNSREKTGELKLRYRGLIMKAHPDKAPETSDRSHEDTDKGKAKIKGEEYPSTEINAARDLLIRYLSVSQTQIKMHLPNKSGKDQLFTIRTDNCQDFVEDFGLIIENVTWGSLSTKKFISRKTVDLGPIEDIKRALKGADLTEKITGIRNAVAGYVSGNKQPANKTLQQFYSEVLEHSQRLLVELEKILDVGAPHAQQAQTDNSRSNSNTMRLD